MPAGLLGGLCKGCEEDRDGLWNWEDACHERVGGQCVWKSFLALVYVSRRVLPSAEYVEFLCFFVCLLDC